MSSSSRTNPYRRCSVSDGSASMSADELRRAGAIEYRRGAVVITGRTELKSRRVHATEHHRELREVLENRAQRVNADATGSSFLRSRGSTGTSAGRLETSLSLRATLSWWGQSFTETATCRPPAALGAHAVLGRDDLFQTFRVDFSGWTRTRPVSPQIAFVPVSPGCRRAIGLT
jgi:hypothetical protein